MAPVYCALVHYPVRDRAGETVTTAVTTLDVHDISRSARTYGLSGYFVVTPISAQHTLVERILGHWRGGAGEQRMPERSDALGICALSKSIEAVVAEIAAKEGKAPLVVATAARSSGLPLASFPELRGAISEGDRPWLVLFGTGHGLSESTLRAADWLLEPICGPTDYNHLSVRSAAAIVFDRLFAGST